MKTILSYLTVSMLASVVGFLFARFLINGDAYIGNTNVTSIEREPLYWVAPMDSNFRRDEPGLSPMGMDLIPVYEEPDTESNAVRVAATIQQNLGLRTTIVTPTDFAREVHAVGYTRWNEATIEMLHPRAEGWLEVFNLASVGDAVTGGQVIYELYAPNLVSAQQEFISASAAGNEVLADLARRRLQALGFTAEQVDDLAHNGTTSSRLVYRATSDALVLALGARRGNFVQPSSSIATLASLDSIWVDVDVFESDAADVVAGLEAEIEFPAFPGERWSGRVSYVYPELDRESRTLRVRLVVDNPDHRLKPNMFADVSIYADPRLDVLAVPREAVIRSGMGSRVIVVLENGEFQPRAVQTGIVSGIQIAILDGLNAGETVVTSGQFLIDAEANGEQALARLTVPVESTQSTEVNLDTASASANETETIYSTTGRIVSIVDDGAVTLAHEPVPDLNWPAMTMGFTTVQEISLSDFEVDDMVRFEFRQTENGNYQILVMSSAGVDQ